MLPFRVDETYSALCLQGRPYDRQPNNGLSAPFAMRAAFWRRLDHFHSSGYVMIAVSRQRCTNNLFALSGTGSRAEHSCVSGISPRRLSPFHSVAVNHVVAERVSRT